MLNNFTETELKNEQWRDIFGYDGAYQVSDLGRVRSHKSGEWKVLRPGTNGKGYLYVILCIDGKRKNCMIHRLVAQAFIDNNDETKTIINHRDECKSDNRVSNIEWCDYQYNSTYNDIHLRRNNSKRRKIEKLYNPDLTIRQNLEIFKANGVECSRRVIKELRKDLGLVKTRKKK